MEEQQNNGSNTDSLTPIVVSPPIDDKGAGKRKDRGQPITFTFFMLVAVLVGVSFFVPSTNKREELIEAGKSINGLKESYFDQFWNCALKGQNLIGIHSSGDLISSIRRQANAAPIAYGNRVKEKCIGYIEDLSVELDRLDAPVQFHKPIAQIVKSTKQLHNAWKGYIEHLINPGMKHEHPNARRFLYKISVGWYKFRYAHNQINRFILEKL